VPFCGCPWWKLLLLSDGRNLRDKRQHYANINWMCIECEWLTIQYWHSGERFKFFDLSLNS
jgi:hypothetical protein